MSATLNQLTGGAFQDPFQDKLSNGYLILTLMVGNTPLGQNYEDISNSVEAGTGHSIKIPLDSNGNIVTSPSYSVYTNDTLVPSGSYYQVSCYSQKGELVWGTNAQQVLSSPSPFDVGAWIPNQFPA